MTTNIVTTA